MKRAFFLFVLFVFAGSWLYQWVATQPSYLLLVIGNTSIEMSAWFALACVLSILVLAVVSYRLLVNALAGVSVQVSRVLTGSKKRAQRQTANGLINFIEGNWKPALRLLNKSAAQSQAPLLNYLGAARSAYELGDEKQAIQLLARAEKSAPNAELAVALTQARMQLLAKKYEQCAATLERAKKLAPKHPVVLDLLRQVYVHLQDWQALECIMPLLSRYKVIGEDEASRLKDCLYVKLLQQAGQSDFSLDELHSVWQKIPKEWRSKPQLVDAYVGLLEYEGASVEAESLLRKVLQKYWDNQLVLRYGLLKVDDFQKQLLQAETWLKERPGNADLLLTLGRLSLRNQLWGKARDYFDSSLKIQGSPEAYAEMARLLAHLGEHQQSTAFYQKGLLLTADHLPDLPLP